MKKWRSLLFTLSIGIASCFVMAGCGEEPHTHTVNKVEAVLATCEINGNTEYYKCTDCDKYFSDANATTEIEENSWVIDAIGHDYIATEWHDNEHQYVKTEVCSHDSTHTRNYDSVTLNNTNLDSTINDDNISNRNWSDYKVTLSEGNYDTFTLKYAGYTTGVGTETSPKIFNRTIGELSFTGEDRETTIMDGLNFSNGFAVKYVNANGSGGADYYLYASYTIDTLKISNMTFTDRIYISSLVNSTYSENATININNIILENVTFDMANAEDISGAALHIISASGGIANVTIKNCTFKNISGTNKGIQIDARAEDDINVTIENCSFTDTGYNAIQLSGVGSNFTGEITIRNNVITNTSDRAIRISTIGSGAVVLITGNVMINASDDSGELMKASVDAGSLVTIAGNYWGAKSGLEAVTGMVNSNGDNIMDTAPVTSLNN